MPVARSRSVRKPVEIALDLSSWSRKELQEFCRLHSLYAGGSAAELEGRVVEAMRVGARVSVYDSDLAAFRPGVVSMVLDDEEIEVTFMDRPGRGYERRAELSLRDQSFILEQGSDNEESSEEESEAEDEEAVRDAFLVASWTSRQLKDYLKEQDLPCRGDRHTLEAVALERMAEERAAAAEMREMESIWAEVWTWKKKELQEYCRLRGLRSYGTKHELQELVYRDMVTERLRLEDTEEEEEEEDDEEGLRDLLTWSRKELQAALRARGLATRGTKEELAERLWEAQLAEAAITRHDSEDDEEHTDEDRGYGDGLDDLTGRMAGLHTWDSPTSVTPGLHGPTKRALIVGASCKGTSSYLPGTLNDTKAIQRLLVDHFKYPNTKDNILVLTDDHSDKFMLPTRRNIERGFEWLRRDVKAGDSLFFYFSGHGGQEPDPTGKEPSGYNQVICPCDHNEDDVIRDTEIHKQLVKGLPMGVTLHALIDSCHSGTVMNLPYNAILRGGKFKDWEEEYKGEAWKRTTAGGLVVQFSAARHDQLAVERPKPGRRSHRDNQGAATYAFISAIERYQHIWGVNIEYGELLHAMYDELRGDRRFSDQEPTLSASTTFDPLCRSTKVRI